MKAKKSAVRVVEPAASGNTDITLKHRRRFSGDQRGLDGQNGHRYHRDVFVHQHVAGLDRRAISEPDFPGRGELSELLAAELE